MCERLDIAMTMQEQTKAKLRNKSDISKNMIQEQKIDINQQQ